MVSYELVRHKFRTGATHSLRFSILELEAVGDAATTVQARARALGLSGPVENEQPTIEDPRVSITDREVTLSIDAVSGTERLVRDDLFHRVPGVPRGKLLSDLTYIGHAERYLEKVLP